MHKRQHHRHPPDNSVVYGNHAVQATLEHMPDRVLSLHFASNASQTIIELAKSFAVKTLPADKDWLFQQCGGDNAHQGVLLKCRSFPYANLDTLLNNRPQLVVVLDGIEDPRNLGRAARSALAFGASFLMISKDRCASITPAAEKAAVGALAQLPVVQATNLHHALENLKQHGIWLYGTDSLATKDIWQADFTGPTAIVIGSEESGLRRLIRESCDVLVRIPMPGATESLNAADCVAISLYEINRQRSCQVE